MSNQNDGGPAFPTENGLVTDQPGIFLMQPGTWPGLSIRDYFAAAAMQGMLANSTVNSDGMWSSDQTAALWSFRLADAMLAARKEKP